MKARLYAALCSGMCVLFSGSAFGQVAPVEKPDPAKFFLFYGAGVSKDQVRGDLVFCIDQAKDILSERDRMPSSGLFAALIEGRMAEIDRFRMRNAAMRKCMGMMGYTRYAVPQAEWNAIVAKGDIVVNDKSKVDVGVIERMVDFATGPKPSGEELPL